ncbi:MAG: CvpA family protein [Pirellulales bacterium]
MPHAAPRIPNPESRIPNPESRIPFPAPALQPPTPAPMQLYDFVMIGVMCGAAIFGAMKGLAWQVASVSSFVLSYMAALKFRDSVAPYIAADAPWNRFGAMLAIFIATSLAIWILFRLVHDIIDRVKLKEFDRQVGFLVGAAKGVLYCVLITFFVVTLWPDAREQVLHSRSGLYIARLIERADKVMPEEVKDVIGPYLERIGSGHDHDESQLTGEPESGVLGRIPAAIFGRTNGAIDSSGTRGATDTAKDTVPDARDAPGGSAVGQGSAAWPNAPQPEALQNELPSAPAPRERSFYDR